MKRIAVGLASVAMAAGATVATTAPAQASPLFTGGLVNVNVSDNEILNNVGVGVAANVAANVCDIGVGVLVQQIQKTGGATCTAVADGAPIEITQSR